jgi:hypothetical protein
MRSILKRLDQLEAARLPGKGGLPVLVVIPDDDSPEDQAAALADIRRRRAAGQHVIAVGPGDDPLAALVDCFV